MARSALNRHKVIIFGSVQHTTAGINLTVNNPEKSTRSFNFSININNYAIVSDNHKYFTFSSYLSNTSNRATNYNFNHETNNLTFSFSFNVTGYNNLRNNNKILFSLHSNQQPWSKLMRDLNN